MDNSFQNLQNVFGIFNPELYNRGEEALNISRDTSLQQLMQSRQNMQQQAQRFPVELRGAELSNQTAEARLPGVMADSSMRQRENRLGAATEDKELEKLLAGYDDARDKAEFDKFMRVGQSYGQAAAILSQLPPPARHAYAKQKLGRDWLPEFDQVPPEMLDKVLANISESSSMMSSRVQAKLAEQAAKQEAALAVEREKQLGRERVITLRATLAKQVETAKASKDPRNLQELATRYFAEARQAKTQEEAEELTKAGNDLLGALDTLNRNRRPDPMPGLPPANVAPPTVPTPQVAPGVNAGGPNPATASRTAPKTPEEASRAGWQYKIDAKGNKAYVNPKNPKELIEVK